MEEISLNRVINTLLENLKRIIVIAIIGVVIGLIYSLFFIDKKYMSSCLVVIPKSSLIEEYSNLITSNEVLESVSNKFNISVSDIKDNVKVDLKNKKIYTIEIVVTNASSSMASNLANSISEEFIDFLKKTYSVNNAKISQVAVEATQYYNFTNAIIIKKCLKVAIVFGILYVLIILAIEFFSDKLKTETFIKEILKINILGTISSKLGNHKKRDNKYFENQADNLVNRLYANSNEKNIFLISTNKVLGADLYNILKSIPKISKNAIVLNANKNININSVGNIKVENIEKDVNIKKEIKQISDSYDDIIVLLDFIDGVNVNENMLGIFDKILLLVRRSMTKISEIELAKDILDKYNKLEDTYCVIVGEEYLNEKIKYKRFLNSNR